MKLRFVTFLMVSWAVISTLPAKAQSRDPRVVARAHVIANMSKWGLQPADVEGMTVSDHYQSPHNGITHVYFIQRHAGIEVHTAICGVHIKPDGEVGYATHRFLPGLAARTNATEPLLTSRQAIDYAAREVGAFSPGALRVLQRPDQHTFVYEGGNMAKSDITAKLVYQQNRKTGALNLAWHVTLDQIDSPDWWSIRVDALTGTVLEKNNWTQYCSFHKKEHIHGAACTDQAVQSARNYLAGPTLVDGATYNVFPLPAESPIHGTQQVVVNPADPTASPYGWHDTNGQPGPEFTITRGNNARAYLDLANANQSSNDEPDGGDTLVFNFPYNEALEPEAMREASVVNLFYMTNMMHDIQYHYGFTEEAGNFQENNYNRGGLGNDPVRSEAQDGGGTNNANFATPPDGQAPRMQMFLWDQGRSELLTVLEPESIVGGFEAGTASFGPAITETPIIGSVVRAVDGSSQPELACQSIVNGAEVSGKIAMVRRGECFFKQKVRNAQLAGAIAVIICNFEESLIGMGDVASVPTVNIPSVMLKNSACQLIRQALDIGQEVVVKLQQPTSTGPARVDGGFDNGIIAHEYGHGISNRLTGGPSQADCLFNGEQMGEGWSDFFTLIMTAKPGDSGSQGRGIGNFAVRSAPNGSGIRRLPYSADPSINRQSYDDIIGTTAPHPLGEIWVGMVWDLYWRLVDEYGWDEDLVNGTGGNNIAIRLVMDGMKLQNCLPGFIDGRDGILAADILNYDGAHECLIWDVFARRGLGYSASQGDNFDRNDGFQAFDVKPECIAELKIAKAVTPLIEAGEEITVTLTATNHKPVAATNVNVSDVIPNGATLVPGSVTGASNFNLSGDVITFPVGDLGSGEVQEISYRLSTSPNLKSIRQIFDGMEDGDFNWGFEALEGIAIWEISDQAASSGNLAWHAPSTDAENDQILQWLEPIVVTGTQPVLRFNHQYVTESGIDGGILQISTDGGSTWERPEQYVFKNGYRGRIYYSAFAIPDVQAFWGNSNGFVDTYFDLSPYIGQEIQVRFRFATDAQEATDPETGLGWFVDDFEIMDMFNYHTEACITSGQGDQACAFAPSRGTIVQPGISTSSEDLNPAATRMVVYPNPSGDFINIAAELERSGRVTIQLFGTDGRMLKQQSMDAGAGAQLWPVSLVDLPKGVYSLRLHTDSGSAVEKVIKR